MRKCAASIIILLCFLSVFLSACQTNREAGESKSGDVSETAISTETQDNIEEQDSETEKHISALPYQFARKHGIIKSEYPVYELDTVMESEFPQKEKKVSLTSAICQDRELIVSIVLDDYSEVEQIAVGESPPADAGYQTLSDGTMIVSEKYQNELWRSGEGMFLTGPGVPENGIKPKESTYASYPEYFEAYGHMRYFIEARFEIPPASEYKDNLSGYSIRLLDFEEPLEFALKCTPAYETLEELVAAEQGSMDTHDGVSIISMGEKANEGILVSWYVYSEVREKRVSIIYKPPFQEIDMPNISNKGKQYSIKNLSAKPYMDSVGMYRLSEVQRYGRRYMCLFDVPQSEQSGSFQVNIPGITFLNIEESSPITLSIPMDYAELKEDVPWKEGTVRILGITRMKEPQIVEIPDAPAGDKVKERPAVYIDVAAVHEDKNLALKGLICQRKLKWTGWEHERYDFDENGNLSGFRIFYEEGDTEVTLKFNGAAFYWNQPYIMELNLTLKEHSRI